MHDGAVIIRNLRIHQAGAVLPLSANTKLDKQLGTRHRAAIGVTEETDAVVVVVSEERGTVSLCFNGNIARDLDAATLRKALLGLFQKKKNNKGKGQPAGRGAKTGAKSGSGDINITGVGVVQPAMPPEHTTSEPSGPTPSRAAVPPELLALVTTQPFVIPVDPSLITPPHGGGVVSSVEPQTEPTIRMSAAQLAAAAMPPATAESATAAAAAADTQRTAPINASAVTATPGAGAALKRE
jgi:hypothetical protein